MPLQPVKFTPLQLNPKTMLQKLVYQINVSSKEEQAIVISVCEKLGYKHTVSKFGDTEEEPWNIVLSDNYYMTFDSRKTFITQTHNGVVITLDELIKLKTFKPKKVKLNDIYTATVYKETIMVGCQTFTHSAIEALYKAMKGVR